jgi:hypothetical protein
MFYCEEEIASSLICPKCQRKFVDPRIIVPCCETLCMSCIEAASSRHLNEFDCHFCGLKHALPEAGFAPNKTIARLLDLRANELFRGSSIEKLKEKLARIQKRVDTARSEVSRSRLVLNEHCSEVKAQVDLLVETKKQELDLKRDELLQQIDAYEQECVARLADIDRAQITLKMDQASEFACDANAYLKNFQIDENLLSEQSQEADSYLENLDKLLVQLKLAQFNGKLLRFRANNGSTAGELTIGQIEFDEFNGQIDAEPLFGKWRFK